MRQKRPTVQIVCSECDRTFEKDRREVNRRLRKDIKSNFYCSRSCLANSSRKNGWSGIRGGDEYSAFRYYTHKSLSTKGGNITVEYLKKLWESQSNTCAFTGFMLDLNVCGVKQDRRFQASLDRIDSTKPYDEGNVQFVSLSLNYAKNDMTNDQFLEFLELIRQSPAPIRA